MSHMAQPANTPSEMWRVRSLLTLANGQSFEWTRYYWTEQGARNEYEKRVGLESRAVFLERAELEDFNIEDRWTPGGGGV